MKSWWRPWHPGLPISEKRHWTPRRMAAGRKSRDPLAKGFLATHFLLVSTCIVWICWPVILITLGNLFSNISHPKQLRSTNFALLEVPFGMEKQGLLCCIPRDLECSLSEVFCWHGAIITLYYIFWIFFLKKVFDKSTGMPTSILSIPQMIYSKHLGRMEVDEGGREEMVRGPHQGALLSTWRLLI